MALFNISVLAHLNLPESVRRALVQGAADQGRIAVATERQAVALEAMVKKLNDDNDGNPNAVTVEFSAGPVREQTR